MRRLRKLLEWWRRRWRTWALAPAGACAWVLACATPLAPDPGAERWVLRSVSGAALPAPGPLGLPVRSGFVELAPDSTYLDVLVIGSGTDSLRGVWRHEGDSVRFTPARAGMHPYAGHLGASALVVEWAEGVFRYTR